MSFISDLLGEAYKEGMTEDEMSKALEKVFGAKDKDYQKVKAAFDKASADLSKYKKDLEARMSEEEKAKAEHEESIKKIMEENESMKKQISIAENKAKLIGLGYSEELASSTAEAMFKGDMQTVLANQKTLLDEREKAIRAGMIDDTPKPPAGDKGGKSMTLAQLRKMSVKDRYDYSQAHPEEYASLYAEGKE